MPPEAFQPLPGGEIEAEAESTPEPELVAQFDEPLAGDEASEWQDPTEPCEAVYDEETVSEYAAEPEAAPDPATKDSPTRPGFSAKLFEKLGNVAGFYGQGIEVPPFALPDLAAETDTGEFIAVVEGSLHSKLSEVRAKADEVRVAQLRSIAALHEGLSAAYDFALDAEQQPEEYLKLVEAQGLKIQLRAPMKPVVKLAFDGLCDEETITRLEAILAWALKMELPRGSLAERLEAEGGIEPILEGLGKAA